MSEIFLENIAIIGEVDAGKSALLDKLSKQNIFTGKTQTPLFYEGHIVDTPGEFVNNRAWNGALLSTIASVRTVICLQPADSKHFAVPSGLLRVYPNKNIVSVISKIDVLGADINNAVKLLKQNDLPKPYFQISIHDQASIANLYQHLLALQPQP